MPPNRQLAKGACAFRGFLTWKAKSRPEIAFIHNRYIGYRLPFFEKLAKMYNMKFFFDQVDPKTKVLECHFAYTVLKSIQILESSIYDITWSPMLPYHLLKGKYDLFIGADIGHLGTCVTFIIAKLLRKPFILVNEGWDYPRTFLRSLRQSFLNIMIRKSNAIVVSGSKAKGFILHSGADPKNVFIAPNASSLAIRENIVFDEAKLKKQLGIEGKYVVLYFGRLIERKGVAVLIQAFSKLQKEFNNSVLVIAGEGEQRKRLESLCKSLKVEDIVFTGYIDEESKSLYYSIADVFVLPSLVHSGEVWDLVLNEAMLLGKPVISTTAAGASYDLIKNGVNGYIVKDGDAEELSIAMKELLKNPKRMKKMGLESKRIVENGFTFDRMVEGFVKAIRYAINLSS